MITETSAATVNQAASPAPGKANSVGGLASDFETFLKMLTAQARYQDPLEPIDSSEYAAQLAQFSMVEQQVKTNETLTSLFSQMGSQNILSMSSWVGMEARAVAPALFQGNAITISSTPSAGADEAFLIVKDSAGKQVQKLPLPLESGPVAWSGLDNQGGSLPYGLYSFEIENRKAGELLGIQSAEVYSFVNEAQIAGDEIVLVMASGISIPASTVTALRNPG